MAKRSSTYCDSTSTGVPGSTARSSTAARRPSSVNVGGMRTSTITRSGCVSRTVGQQAAGVAERGDHLGVVLGEQAGDPLAEQHRVLGDDDPHDAHGSSTWTTVGPPFGLDRRERALDRGHPVTQAGQAAAGMLDRAATPVVAHVDQQRRAELLDAHAGLRRPAVLGQVGQRLGDDEVGARLDRRRRPAAAARRRSSPAPCSCRQRRQRGVETAIGEHLRMDAAHQLAQLADRRLGLLVRPADQLVGARTDRRRGPGAPWPCRGPSPGRRGAAGRRRAGRARCAAAPWTSPRRRRRG